MPPLVSVIVIVYNGEKFLTQCLSSLLNLDFLQDKLEIIVVDNNSTDGTKKIIQQYPVKYVFEPKMGPAAARNRGIKESKGQYIAFIDSDKIANRSWLKHLLNAIENDSDNVGAVAGEIRFYIPKTFWEEYIVFNYTSAEHCCLAKVLSKRALPHLALANAIIKRNFFDVVGFFDENLLRGEDFDLCLRILLKGYKLKYIPEAAVYESDLKNFWRYFHTRLINGQNIAKTIYKYKNIFQYNIVRECIKNFMYDFLDIVDRYKLAVEEKRFKVLFLVLSILFCIVQSLGVLVGILKGKDKISILSKSFVRCNKNTADININGQYLSCNTHIVPLIFDGNEEVMFLDSGRSSFYSLKGIGIEIWELMTQGRNIPEIIEIISLKYNIDKGIVETDLKDLLTEFKERNILI